MNFYTILNYKTEDLLKSSGNCQQFLQTNELYAFWDCLNYGHVVFCFP